MPPRGLLTDGSWDFLLGSAKLQAPQLCKRVGLGGLEFAHRRAETLDLALLLQQRLVQLCRACIGVGTAAVNFGPQGQLQRNSIASAPRASAATILTRSVTRIARSVMHCLSKLKLLASYSFFKPRGWGARAG